MLRPVRLAKSSPELILKIDQTKSILRGNALQNGIFYAHAGGVRVKEKLTATFEHAHYNVSILYGNKCQEPIGERTKVRGVDNAFAHRAAYASKIICVRNFHYPMCEILRIFFGNYESRRDCPQ